MKKVLTLIAILCTAAMLFVGCSGFPFPVDPTEPPPTEAPTVHTHTPEDDDGDCTTAVNCSECGEVAVEAMEAHEAADDDGDCTTAVTCVNCTHIMVSAQNAHEAGADDDDCATPVKCVNCEKNAIEAKNHVATVTDCTVDVKCENCEQLAHTAKEAHIPGEDDGDVTTPVKCAHCEYIVIGAKTPVDLTIPTFENGAIVTDKKNYAVGDTVVLTVTPNEGFSQKLYINNEALLLDSATSQYSFTIEEGKTYEFTGGFVAKSGWFWTADWDLVNQGHNIAHAPAHTDSERTGDLVPQIGLYNGVSVLFKDVTHGDQTAFAIVLKTHFVGGLKSEVRLIDRDDNGKYCLQAMGDSFSSWDTFYWLTAEENAAVANGNGVWYSMIRQDAKLYLFINDKIAKIIDLSANGVTADTEIDQIKIQAYNFAHEFDVAYRFHQPITAGAPTVEMNIGTFTNGTVTVNKDSFQMGDIVSLTVSPADGYVQKLYINGEPLMLDWNTNTYTFVVTEEVYNITGSFEKAINIVGKDANRWDSSNQAHGVINTYYPAHNDSWWVDINGEYQSIAIIAKNYLPTEASKDYATDPAGYHTILRMALDNGKTYAFRIYNDKGTYAVSCTAESGSVTGWDNWKNINHLADAITGDGVEFKVERVSANVLEISVNGTVLFSYTMGDVTADNKVVSVGIDSKGNKCCYVTIPFEVVAAETVA